MSSTTNKSKCLKWDSWKHTIVIHSQMLVVAESMHKSFIIKNTRTQHTQQAEEQTKIWYITIICLTDSFLAATKQLYKWYFPSVRLSVTPFWLCSHNRIIMKFSGVITSNRNDVHAKGQGQRSKVKVTEVTTQLYRFRTVTPVWIHIWWWNDAYSLIMLRRGALLFFKVICQISRSHGSKNRRIWPRLGVSGL